MYTVQFWVPWDIGLGLGILGHMVISFLVFKEFHIVLHSGYINLYSYQQYKRAPFSPHPLQHLLTADFFDDQCEMIPHRSFDLHFSNNEGC